jgi:hypothetical protein
MITHFLKSVNYFATTTELTRIFPGRKITYCYQNIMLVKWRLQQFSHTGYRCNRKLRRRPIATYYFISRHYPNDPRLADITAESKYFSIYLFFIITSYILRRLNQIKIRCQMYYHRKFQEGNQCQCPSVTGTPHINFWEKLAAWSVGVNTQQVTIPH